MFQGSRHTTSLSALFAFVLRTDDDPRRRIDPSSSDTTKFCMHGTVVLGQRSRCLPKVPSAASGLWGWGAGKYTIGVGAYAGCNVVS